MLAPVPVPVPETDGGSVGVADDDDDDDVWLELEEPGSVRVLLPVLESVPEVGIGKIEPGLHYATTNRK